MSFVKLLGSAKAVRDSYPDGIARLAAEPEPNEELKRWQRLPECFAGCCMHICTIPDFTSKDITRKYHIAYSSDVLDRKQAPTTFCRFSLRLQMFLGRHNLAPLGNRDGQSKSACKTSMFLTLRSAEGFRDQYNAQSTAMSNIRKFVLRTLGDSEPSDIMKIPDEPYLRRRVFTRVSPANTASSNPHIAKVAGLAKKPASALTSDDDPQGKAACVADSWRVPEKVIFYMRAGNGRVKRCSPYVFGVGDLVDVNSYVDVATYRGPRGSTFTKVYFSFDRLIQLCPALSVKKMRRETVGTGQSVS